MNKQQWKAMYDFCKDNGYYNPSEVLHELKAIEAVDERTTFDELEEYPRNGSYDAMIDFLTENLY